MIEEEGEEEKQFTNKVCFKNNIYCLIFVCMLQIRRPLSAWMIYCNENRKSIKEANPEFGFKEISRALSEGFKGLSEEERSVFDKKFEEDKERFVHLICLLIG